MSYPPALVDAAKDPDLAGTPLRVYLWLVTHHLDTVDFRPVKVTGLSFAMRVERNTVTKALNLLVLRGYLTRKYMERDGYWYRYFTTRQQPLVGQSKHTAVPN
jgi:predicted transcriptional regulator